MDQFSEDLKVVYKDPNKLFYNPRNARLHSESQTEKLAEFIKKVGFLDPIEIDENDVIIAGHGRQMAAIKMGMHQVPCVVHSNLSEADKEAYGLCNNRFAELSTWSPDMLKIVCDDLNESGYQMNLIGWDDSDLQAIYNYGINEEITGAGTDPGTARSVSVAGDVWLLGKHKLHCGVTDLLEADQLIEKWNAVSDTPALLQATKQLFSVVKKERLG